MCFSVNIRWADDTCQSVTHALYHLATETEYIKPLRDEVDPIVSAEGWTRASIGKMWKLDSVIKESQRYDGINLGTPSTPPRLPKY